MKVNLCVCTFMCTIWTVMFINQQRQKDSDYWPGTALFVSAAPALLCLLPVSDSTSAAGCAAEISSPPIQTHTHNIGIHKEAIRQHGYMTVKVVLQYLLF